MGGTLQATGKGTAHGDPALTAGTEGRRDSSCERWHLADVCEELSRRSADGAMVLW